MPAGRPTDFKPQYCKLLIDHLSKGHSFESFAGVVDSGRETIYGWARKYPEFSDAKTVGEGKRAVFLETMGLNGAQGNIKNFNPTAYVWFTKNVLGWRDKQDIELSGKDGGPIKSVAMNINADAQSLTDKELRDAVIKIIQGESANDTTNERTITSGVSDSLRLPG